MASTSPEEDLIGGDLTSEACIDPGRLAAADARARKALVACGGPVFARVFQRIDPALTVEIHVPDGAVIAEAATMRSVAGRARAILMGERVLLDNMDTATVELAVRRARGKALTEASGGVTLARVRELAEVGVDYISVGALTHSAPAADIGLDFRA